MVVKMILIPIKKTANLRMTTSRWKVTRRIAPRMFFGKKRVCNPTKEEVLTRLIRITEPQGWKEAEKSYSSTLPSKA